MDDLRRQEEEDMMRGTFNYGFQPIEEQNSAPVAPILQADDSDWKSRITGGAQSRVSVIDQGAYYEYTFLLEAIWRN